MIERVAKVGEVILADRPRYRERVFGNIGSQRAVRTVETRVGARVHDRRRLGVRDYDKTNLPDPLILTNYFSVHDEKIVSLITIRNKPSEY